MHAEGILFVRLGYDGPEDVDPNAMAGWAALNTKLIELGALDASTAAGGRTSYLSSNLASTSTP